MAHENLKFNVHLNTDHQDWQPIYASQDFDTFYVIYVKFTKIIEDETKVPGDNKTQINCDFKIQNFRGAVSHGFLGAPEIKLPDNADDAKEFGLIIEVPLKAFHFNETSLKNAYLLKDKINRKKLLITRRSIQLPKGMYNQNNPIKSDYLFPYKYERDGNVAIELGRRPAKSNGDFQEFDENIGNPKFGSVCSPDTSKIF